MEEVKSEKFVDVTVTNTYEGVPAEKMKEVLLRGIKVQLQEMKYLLSLSKSDEKAYQIPEKAILLPVEMIQEAFEWVTQIRLGGYAEAMKIWKLLDPKIWERYEKFGCFNDHAESKLLVKHLKALRFIVTSKKRPSFFKPGKIKGRIKRIERAADVKDTDADSSTDKDKVEQDVTGTDV